MNKIGFGFLRLSRMEAGADGIDWSLLNRMTDTFLASGGNYFDTAYTYLDGRSEEAVRKSVVERYPRNAFQIADKLPLWKVMDDQDCYTYFARQRERCGVDFLMSTCFTG